MLEWCVLRSFIFGEVTGTPISSKRLESTYLRRDMLARAAYTYNLAIDFCESPEAFMLQNKILYFQPTRMVVLGITPNPEPESPEVISEYPDAMDIAKMGRCALSGKPVSLTGYLLARFEYINEYAKARLRRHSYHDF